MKKLLSSLLLVSVAVSCGPTPTPSTTFPPFVHLAGLPSERAVVRTIDESVTFEVQVLTPDGSPAAFADYVLEWGERPPATKADEIFTTEPATFASQTLLGWTMRTEHIEPNIERLTITASRRDVPQQPSCRIGRVRSRSAEDRQRADYMPCPGVPVVQFWGGVAKTLTTPQESISLTVGEQRPVLFSALTEIDQMSHHAITHSVLNTAVATVSPSGVVTAIAPGTTFLLAQVDGLTKRVGIVVTNSGPPGPPRPEHTQRTLAPSARNYYTFNCFENATLGAGLHCRDETSTFTAAGLPEVTFGTEAGGAIARWTGTGFGAEALAPPWLKFTRSALPTTRDEGGTFFTAVGRDGAELLVRSQAPDAGVGEFSDVRIPFITPFEIMGEQLPSRDEEPRFVASGFASLAPRRGGGAWVLWTTRGEYPDARLRVGSLTRFTEIGYCVITTQLAEVVPGRAPRVETVQRTHAKYFKTGIGSETPCSPEGSSDAFYPGAKPYRLLGQGAEEKPTILLGGEALVFEAGRWRSVGLPSWEILARGNTPTASTVLLPEPITGENGGHPLTTLLWRFADAQAFPRQMTTWATDEGYEFGAPRVGFRGATPAPYERFVAAAAAGFWVLRDDLHAMRFMQLDTFGVIELPRDPPLPDATFAQGKRVVAAASPRSSPVVHVAPVGDLLFGDDGVVYSSATQVFLPIAGAIDGGAPSQKSSLPGDVELINGEYVVVGASAPSALGPFAPTAAFSTDGITWATRDGQTAAPWYLASTKTLPSLEAVVLAGPTTPAASGAWEPVNREPLLFFSPNVKTDAFVPLPGLSALAVMRGVAVDFSPRSTAVIETDTGEFAVVANFHPTEWPTQRTTGRDGLWVRRLTRAGVLHDDVLVRFPAQIANVATANFVDARSTQLVGDTLSGFYVSIDEGGTCYPFTLNLLTSTWQLGPALTTTPSQPEPGFFGFSLNSLPAIALFRRPGGGFLAVSSGIGPGGRAGVFTATSSDGLTWGPKTFLRPTGGFRQRLTAATLDASGAPLLVIGDSMAIPLSTNGLGSLPPYDTLVLRVPWP